MLRHQEAGLSLCLGLKQRGLFLQLPRLAAAMTSPMWCVTRACQESLGLIDPQRAEFSLSSLEQARQASWLCLSAVPGRELHLHPMGQSSADEHGGLMGADQHNRVAPGRILARVGPAS